MKQSPVSYLTELSLVAALALTPLVQAQSAARIHSPINDAQRTSLFGNVRSAALDPLNDRGAVSSSLPLDHMLLQLQRSPESEAALTSYIATLNDPSGPNYHKWLTAAQLGTTYGPAPEDIASVESWLKSNGLTVNSVDATGMVIDFSGNASQVEEAFHPALHNLSVNGVAHIANTQNPSIPTALVGVVGGVVSLNDFRPHAMHKNVKTAHIDVHSGTQTSKGPNADYTYTSGSSTYQAVVPGDLATIYNLTPLFTAGFSGQGQTIVVIEDTNVYSTTDWTTFRSTFGLSTYTAGSFTQEHPGSNCTNPGTNADDGEAILDAEWASAAAPSAAIVLASCKDTSTTFGGLIALENIVSGTAPPKIVSISYGESESENGATANAAYNSTYKSAAAEGISVFVSSGDEGAASSDADLTKATHGITVSGFASTPYNVAVGGTDFGDTATATNSSYWNTTNTSTYASAKSYIPEIPWNDSCASTLLAKAQGYSATYGTSGFCNSTTGKADYLTTASGSGGPSGCATGTASTSGEVTGTCKGYAKPTWQALVGVPADGVRDIPDVSLFAANGVWGHYYVYCWSDTREGGVACKGAPSAWSGAGGTSFASPIMAAIQALVNQKTASSWGLPTPTYYNLAKAEYGSAGSTTCNSSNGNAIGSSCTFYDVTSGDMDVNCTGKVNCYIPSGTNGVLSTSTTSYLPAYKTTTGWDFATGIGTINAYNLVNNWGTVSH
ncbi:S53 family peptidase [Granulicella paludicola]|uniref:S53 family peptidase n=1 Tax=Granulicella paludicola TaxID=474951 RepID=UPI0021DFC4AD|nr:S53 family peptidase [Granulicella paludicola]